MAGNHNFKCPKCGVLNTDLQGCACYSPFTYGWHKCVVRKGKVSSTERVWWNGRRWETEDKVLRWEI